jgi:inorganic pyrophosphatase
MGSKHPQHDYYYPVNYGYIPNTKAPDGKEIDVYILGIFKPLTKYTGKCVAIVQRKDDQDDKLIIIPTDAKYNINYSDDEIKAIIQFQERFFESKITRE